MSSNSSADDDNTAHMPVSLRSVSGEAYSLGGFQSLSGGQTLALRTGSAPKQQCYVAPRWCPSIDVLAVPEGRALRLVRLSGGETVWRRVHEDGQPQTPKSDSGPLIQAVAWSPRGTSIAVLYSDGLLVQRDSTRGDVVHEVRVDLDGPAVAMEWIACTGADLPDAHQPPLEALLPQLSPIGRGQPTASHASPEAEPPTAIVITGASGLVCVCLGGTFALPPTRLLASLVRRVGGPSGRAVAVDARLSADSATLFVLVADSDAAQHMALCAVDTSVLSSTLPLLQALVPLSARLSGLWLYLDNTLRQLANEAEARDKGASRAALLQTFEGVLRDHGVDEATSPEAELCQLAVTGRASEAMSEFLLGKLKAARLRNWESAGRLGAVALTRLVYQHALPAVERAILAATRMLDVVDQSVRQLGAAGGASGAQSSDARGRIARAVVLLGWLYSQLGEYMDAVREEQRENQEFADWALFVIDDLHWQHDGPRRLETDEDDNRRPTRPEFDYSLLLGFIRRAFRRPDEGGPQPPTDTMPCILGDSRDDGGPAEALAEAYFGLLAERANLDQLKAMDTQAGAADREPFRYVFHSRSLLDAAAARCSTPALALAAPPSCVEALARAKELVSEAFRWPAHVLGTGLQWRPEPVLAISQANTGACEPLTAMHCVAEAEDGGGAVFVASVSQPGQLLVITTAGGGRAAIARVELTVDVGGPTRVPVTVTGLSFFDDAMLGIAFTVDGCKHPFLGAIEYRPGALAYGDDVTASRLEFVRVQLLANASAEHPVALASNGAKGRRCVAVVEKRGRAWWPYDMDNEEDGGEMADE
ncbi:anaphase promoting complex subunit 4 [Coemansia spiralis]|nr:anaphase promoting complex subunit 4 [Coemansia spiralis]